jgi:hypothetical protein
MPIESYVLENGSLTLDDGTPFDVSLQVTGCKINPSENVNRTDAIKVLGGDELPAQDRVTYTYTLSGTMVQDIAATGIVTWSWENEGVEVGFVFVPSDAEARQWSGIVRVIPLTVGGEDIEGRPTAEFEWSCIGKPVPGAVV